MRVARRFAYKSDDGEVVEDFQEVHLASMPRLMGQKGEHATSRDLRRQRDLLWICMSNSGFTPEEIATICGAACRSRAQIYRRLNLAEEVYPGSLSRAV